MKTDTVHEPAHYTVYPVQPIQLTRHLGFCLGNAVKYVLRAPYKGGMEDCDKALRYLGWVGEGGQQPISIASYRMFERNYMKLARFLVESPGDTLWDDISVTTQSFLEGLNEYLLSPTSDAVDCMCQDVRELSRILSLRDTTGQIYDGLSGLPEEAVK